MEEIYESKARPVPAGQDLKKKLLVWGNLITFTILAGYFYIFNEWLFYVTKPSFMDQLPFGTKLGILFLSGLLLVGISLPLLLLVIAASLVPWWSRYWKIYFWIGSLLPAIFMAATALTMVDNFTYTVFKFGIVSTEGVRRGIYAFLFFCLLLGFIWWVVRALYRQTRRKQLSYSSKMQIFACAAILVISIPLGGSLYLTDRTTDMVIPDTGSAVKRPNILLIGSDGINSDLTSLYGYEHDTTPFLKIFAKNALLAENNFPNANLTTGSLVSMFTGKLSTETRVLFPPDILKGADSFQHLPGILKREGYYNATISVDYYGDANAVNLQDGFVMVNGRLSAASGLYTFARRFIPEDTAYFLSAIAKRLTDRIFHIFYIRRMPNPYAEVTGKLDNSNDQERVDQILSLFRNIQQPLFVHVYMMGTHLYLYDSYDDAVRNFDGYVRKITDELAQIGKLEDTIIIVYSDHGKSNMRNVRTPLIIRFPNGEYEGKIINNTQNLDIAPTILDYLGIKPPDWMTGLSLLSGEPSANRPIFSAVPNFTKNNEMHQLELDLGKIKPPFYQFGIIDMVICHKWYSLDTSSLTWHEGYVRGYPTPCDEDTMPNDRQAQQILLDQLKKDGFDVTALIADLRMNDTETIQ